MARRTHFPAFERLSPEAQVVVHRGFAAGWTDALTIKKIFAETGEKIPPSSLARYRSRWEEKARRYREKEEQALAIMAAAKAGDTTAEQMVAAFVNEALISNSDALANADPLELSKDQIARLKLERDREEIQLRREVLEFNKQEAEDAKRERTELKAEKERDRIEREREKQRMKEIVNQTRDANGALVLSPEQVRDIRGIYGL